MSKILLVDDLRDFVIAPDNLIVARNSAEALQILADESIIYDQIWFDHDLGMVDGSLDTTIPVVDYMCERAYFGDPVNVGTVYIHTSNPVGRDNIRLSLTNYYSNIRTVYDLNGLLVAG